MNLLSNSCQQTGKKSENRKKRAYPATAPPEKFLLLLRYNLFIGVNEMRVKILNNIIYTTLCKTQQIYYIHNVVQMQLISYIYAHSHNAFH